MEPEEQDEMLAKNNTKAQVAGRRGAMPAALGLPCDLCIAEERQKIAADKAMRGFRALPEYKKLVSDKERAIALAGATFTRETRLLQAGTKEGQEWSEHDKKRNELDLKHPRCKACGLAAGGMHHAQLNKNGICSECERDIKASPAYAQRVKEGRGEP